MTKGLRKRGIDSLPVKKWVLTVLLVVIAVALFYGYRSQSPSAPPATPPPTPLFTQQRTMLSG
jgi:hypothetical protein